MTVIEHGSFSIRLPIAALCFFYLSNSATLNVIFGRDLLSKEARDERLAHMVALVLAALTEKMTASFGSAKTPKAARYGTAARLTRRAATSSGTRLAVSVNTTP